MNTDGYCKGDRIRLTRSTPAAHEGDEATVLKVVHNPDGSVKALDILIDNDPTTTHGTTVFPNEVTKIATESAL